MRPVEIPGDLADLESLFGACQVADGHAPLGEHKYLSLVGGDPGSSLGFVEEERDQMISYVHLSPGDGGSQWTFEVAVHPTRRSPERLRDLAVFAMSTVASLGAVQLRTWVFNPTWAQPLSGLGFRQERELRQLRVRLPHDPPSYPADVTSTSFRPGDESAWLAVNNAAFSGHPENGSWHRSHLEDRMAQAWWDPAGIAMAWSGGALQGFCWTKVHQDGLGEIYVIAVAPAARRRGLGKALTLDGLARLHERGCGTGMLYVDAANRPGLTMYEALGFELHHVDRAMVVDGLAGQERSGPPKRR